jgi:hypothetical protein
MKDAVRGRRAADGPAGELLERAYVHLNCRPHDTASLAAALGVSTATASRLIRRMRKRGHRIVSMKEGRRWFFRVDVDERVRKDDPFLKLRGFIRGVRWPRGRSLNEVIDETLYGS